MGKQTSDDASPLADGKGMDRRTLIKASAVAGASAWTAPVIVDSFLSPAAAGSLRGDFCFQYNAGSGTCPQVVPPTSPCAPGRSGVGAYPGWPCANQTPTIATANCANSPGAPGVCSTTTPVAVFTIPASQNNCTFTYAGGRKQVNDNCRSLFNDTCTDGTLASVIRITNGGLTLSYYPCATAGQCDQAWANFTFVITCS